MYLDHLRHCMHGWCNRLILKCEYGGCPWRGLLSSYKVGYTNLGKTILCSLHNACISILFVAYYVSINIMIRGWGWRQRIHSTYLCYSIMKIRWPCICGSLAPLAALKIMWPSFSWMHMLDKSVVTPCILYRILHRLEFGSHYNIHILYWCLLCAFVTSGLFVVACVL